MKHTLLLLLACGAHLALAGVYTDRFMTQYNKMKNSSNGYFSKEGIPYHAVETMVVEAPDYGHETTSEAYSFWIWMEAMYGAINDDFSRFNEAWQNMETYIIPGETIQPTNGAYNPSKPASYLNELDHPSDYPSQIEFGVSVGQDPIYQELVNAYGSNTIYGMHWLLDVDNIYGFGDTTTACESGPYIDAPSYINSYQRGPLESVWRTIPQPTCDTFKYGGSNGFLDLFVKDNSYATQWKYTNAPDADARAIQGAFWASRWAAAAGKSDDVASTLAKAGKMGDYLRYAMFDKYFKKIGNCIGPYNCEAGTGKNSAHYLLSWYYAWGGSLSTWSQWAWRIGDGAAHFGYQNPLAAYALTTETSMLPKSATGVSDWQTSLARQLELYEYLQTSEGAFAGGVTNSWKGRYDTPDSNLTTDEFYGMFYDWEPVYHDPPSNRWFGMQPWSSDRLAQYYYVSGDDKAKTLLDNWVTWVLANVKVDGATFSIPNWLSWTGVPPDVHVTIDNYSTEVGSAASLARTLAYYAAKSGNAEAKALSKSLLDALWEHQDDLGIAIEETLDTYTQFNEPVYVPSGWTGTYPNGDKIDSSATFIGIRSWYKNDPRWSIIEEYLNGGAVPQVKIHRFWHQAEIALAFGAYGLLFNE